MVVGTPEIFTETEKRTETEMDNLSPLCPTNFLELSTALQVEEKEEFSIEKNSSKKDSAIFMKKIKSPKSPSMDRRSRLFKRLLLLHIPVLYPLSTIRSLESVQDFLIKLDMKPCMHLVETSIFSLNPVIVRPTKIMNRADKNWAQF